MRPWVFILASLGLLLGGCDAGGEPAGTRERRQGPRKPAYCPEGPGKSVRGRVLAPDWFVERGGAPHPDAGESKGRERRELPVRGVDVSVRQRDEEAALVETTTDSKGRWCVDLSDTSTGMDLVAVARLDSHRLRRPVITRYGTTISVRSEALLQLVEKRTDDLSTVSPALYLNLESIASTAVDLLDPVEWNSDETVSSAIDKVATHLRADRRIEEKLRRFSGE